MANRVRLDTNGVGVVLKSPGLRSAAKDAAERVADNVRAMGIGVGDRTGGKYEIDLPVKVSAGTSDRARATVTLAHPAGQAVQAKHGALTKAAKQAGLDVNT